MQSAKYAPLGYRGMFGGRQSYGVPDYFQAANDQSMVIVLLEEAEALQNLDEILRVDDIDVFFVAPSDLAQTMGHLGNPGHPEVQAAIDAAIARIVASGRTAGTLVNDGNAADYIEKGVKFLMTSFNAWIARGAAEFMGKVAGRG
jgi:2-keto-3-deoxy-L-rhamnonate aldolase RhmA